MVYTKSAERNNSHFAKAWPIIRGALKQIDGELWRMISDDSKKLDLVFKSDLGITEGCGETKLWAFYNDPSKRTDNLQVPLNKNIELKDERITIVIQVVPPILHFVDRNRSQAAVTVAHEYAIHAERFVEFMKQLREQGSDNLESRRKLVDIWDGKMWDTDLQHKAIFDKSDPHYHKYQELIQAMMKHTDKTHAKQIAQYYVEDVKEHKGQASLKEVLPEWLIRILGGS